MSHYAPTVRFYVSRPALQPVPGAGPYPAWVMNALGGIPATIAPTIQTTGKTIAGTFLDLFSKPELLAEAKRRARRACGGRADAGAAARRLRGADRPAVA